MLFAAVTRAFRVNKNRDYFWDRFDAQSRYSALGSVPEEGLRLPALSLYSFVARFPALMEERGVEIMDSVGRRLDFCSILGWRSHGRIVTVAPPEQVLQVPAALITSMVSSPRSPPYKATETPPPRASTNGNV